MLNKNDAYQFINQIALQDIGLFILSIFVISLTVRGVRALSDWASKKYPSQRMVLFGWVPVVTFIFYFVGLCTSFYIIFTPSRQFLTAFIVSGLFAIGFAVKDIVTSVIAGIILLIDKPFQLGDRITFQGHYGEILNIGLRSVKVLTLDESVVTIPNNRFLTDAVSSSSAGDLGMMTTVNVHVSLEADLYKMREILQEEAEKSQYVDVKRKITIAGKEMLGVNGTVSLMMTVSCIIKDARQERAFQTDFLLAANKKFKMHAIKFLPYHRHSLQDEK